MDKGEYYCVNRLKEEAEIQSADIDAFVEASSKTGEGVDAVFQVLTEILTDRIRSQNSTTFWSGEDEKKNNSHTLDTDGRQEKERAKESEKEKKTEEMKKKTEKKEEEEKKKEEEEEKGGAVKIATPLLLVDEAVGKTQLLQRFKGEAFSNVYCTTIGVDYATKNLLLPNADVVKVMVGKSTAGAVCVLTFWSPLPNLSSHHLSVNVATEPKSIIGGSCHKYLLSRQKYACRDKTFLATSIFLSRQRLFVTTKHVFYRNKHVFVATKCVFCRDKSLLVATKRATNQQKFCRDKRCVCRDKSNTCGTRKVKKNAIYYDKTQRSIFYGEPLFQATKQHLKMKNDM